MPGVNIENKRHNIYPSGGYYPIGKRNIKLKHTQINSGMQWGLRGVGRWRKLLKQLVQLYLLFKENV